MPDSVLKSRRAGVLLHPTSLPGRQACGSLGAEAHRWLDWLADAGFRIWQVLPLTPVADGSPYNSYSAFAGNLQLIDIEAMSQLGFPPLSLNVSETAGHVMSALQMHYVWFKQQSPGWLHAQFAEFICQQHWLEDFCLFAALKHKYQCEWAQWPTPLRDREPAALAEFAQQEQAHIDFQRFGQFIFAHQWLALKRRANERDILVFGDVPIFVAHDSVDVWCHRSLFKLESNGQPVVVAGVPPDYFSAQGQRWGNPLYDWSQNAADGFTWWQQRINYALAWFDAVRIDHFRGFAACWEIPASENTAIHGQWVPGPGESLFDALLQARTDLPLIAEDLGTITPDVIDLRKQFKLPGMKILQFAFDSGGANPYLPHNHSRDSVVYTGTHDNSTTLGWFDALSNEQKNQVLNYFAWPGEPMPWPLIKSALASCARWAIVPLQDLLCLGAEHRMNTPGTTEGNWHWRFQWQQIDIDLANYLRSLNQLYHRL